MLTASHHLVRGQPDHCLDAVLATESESYSRRRFRRRRFVGAHARSGDDFKAQSPNFCSLPLWMPSNTSRAERT